MEENQILFDQLRVLLIEDSDNDALIIAKMLEREANRFKVVRAQTREEMELALSANVFDVILCDHDMPEFSSRGALEVRDGRGLDLPFIIVTGAIGGEEVAIELMRSGVADFVPKHKMTRLLPAIKREIREARIRQAKRDADDALRRKNAELESTLETLVRTQDELIRSGRLKGLGRMAAGITHELNNALSRISGLVEQLEESGDSASTENFGLIRRAVDDAITTVRSLSYFSDVHPRDTKGMPVNINEAIAESLDIFTSHLDANRRLHDPQVIITTQLRDTPPVTGDEAHFRDAITSLILRAKESMPQGGELKISSYRISVPKGPKHRLGRCGVMPRLCLRGAVGMVFRLALGRPIASRLALESSPAPDFTMEVPETHVMNKVHWQFFGTLTFKKERMAERHRLGMWFALLRQTGKQFKTPFPNLLWILRQERGELFGRTHFHYLLAGLDRRVEHPTTCFWLMNRWEQLNGGMSRVHVFDPRLGAGAYMLKGEGAFNDRTLGGDTYESTKFASPDCELMIANSVWKVARRRS